MEESDKKHRFEFRDRAKTQAVKQLLPVKRSAVSKYLPDSDFESDYSDNNINAFEYNLEDVKAIPFALPRAKTQANKTQKILNSQKKRFKADPFLVAKQILDNIIEAIEANSPSVPRLNTTSYISCDLRYIDPEEISSKFGYFDIIVVDPPWQSTENEPNSLTNQEILNIPLEKLSRGGFCFLWILNHNTNAGYECLNKWGYDIVDRLVWVKTLNDEKKVEIATGRFFMRSSVICLIGYKSLPNDRVEFRSKIANDIIVSDIKKNWQKPDQLYTIIDLMMPGSKKVEIFAKNNNLKSGWLSLGNEIGERFLDVAKFFCKKCQSEIRGTRYKDLKNCANYCETCRNYENPEEVPLDLSNNLHAYHKCTLCLLPIIGIRFQCLVCDSTDLCESN